MTPGSSEIPPGLKKEWRGLAERMRDASWTFEKGTKYIKAFAPDGVSRATLPMTPSDRRALMNAIGDFRRWCRRHNIDPGI
jgi:hypothetical protein